MRAKVEEVVEGMTAPLRHKFEAIREALASATGEEVRGRHRVGVMIIDLQADENKYGKKAVATVARALGVDATTLYRYGSVARLWDAASMRALMRRQTTRGQQPISWCHLLELARVRPAGLRSRLLERVFAEGLSVRELARLIAEVQDREADHDGHGDAQGVLRELAKLARVAETYTSRSSILEEVLAKVEATRPSGEVARVVHELLVAEEEAHEMGRRVLERLRSVEAKLVAANRRGNATGIMHREPAESPNAPVGQHDEVGIRTKLPVASRPHVLVGGH